jgi:DNA gyrase/topoisomerase IV subunit A
VATLPVLLYNGARSTTEAPLAQTQHIDIDAALQAEQERLTSRKQELETELGQITQRLARIERYFADEPQHHTAPRRQPTDRAQRGEVKASVEKIVLQHTGGITRAEINKQLPDANGQSISNALAALKEDGVIMQSAPRQPYFPAKPPTAEAEAAT